MKNISFTDDHMPRLCRKNDKWQLPRAIGPIEGCLRPFEDKINQETRKRKHLEGSNLTESQQNGLNYLINNKQHAELIVDKNT